MGEQAHIGVSLPKFRKLWVGRILLFSQKATDDTTESTTNDGQPEPTADPTEPTTDDGSDGTDGSGAMSVKSSIVLSSMVALIAYLQN